MVESSEHLALLHTEFFLPLFLSYVEQNKHQETNYDVIVLNNEDEYTRLLPEHRALGIRFITQEDFIDTLQHEHIYEDVLLIPAHGLFFEGKRILEKIKFQNLVYFADGLQNTLLWDLEIQGNVKSLVYLFYDVREDSVNNLLRNKFENIISSTISLENYLATWKKIHLSQKIELKTDFSFKKSDLLLIDRYWGTGFYEYSNEPNDDFYKQIIDSNLDFDRIIYAASPVVGGRYSKNFDLIKFFAEKNNKELLHWDNIFKIKSSLNFVNRPESILFLNKFQNLGHILTFDGSMGWIAKVMNPSINLVWPKMDENLFRFKDNRAKLLIEKRRKFFQSMIDLAGKNTHYVIFDGYDLLGVFQESSTINTVSHLNAGINEINNLREIEKKLALVLDSKENTITDMKNELKKLITSRSYRYTQPLRQFKQFIRRYF